MTEKLYDKDSHLKTFYARVLSCESTGENYSVVLDKTAFFPEGGGQESDMGFIDNAEVSYVGLDGDTVFHITDTPLPVGAEVTGVIDWERRFDFMQQHTGEHILSGVAHTLYGCENVGFHLSEDTVTLDFDKILSREQLAEIERLANIAVFENREVYTYYPDKKLLKQLKYRSKKEIDGDIRIVEIEGTDVCACCAPHVKFTGEVGIIKLLSTEKLRGGIRIEIKCGGRALRDYGESYENTAKIGDMLSVKYNETAAAAERLRQEYAELKGKNSVLKKRIIEEKTKAFENEEKITALFEDDFDIKELQLYSNALYEKSGGIRAVFTPAENGYAFAICGEPQRLDTLFASFKRAFSVKGGGRNGMVQGTVFAEKRDLEEFFKIKNGSFEI